MNTFYQAPFDFSATWRDINKEESGDQKIAHPDTLQVALREKREMREKIAEGRI